MNLKKKIIYSVLIFLFICLSYYYYYYIGKILSDNCNGIIGGYYYNDGLIMSFIKYYKVGNIYYCDGYFSLLERAKFTLPLYFLFLWITLVPFIIYKFELKKKYNFFKSNIFYIIGLIILILIVLFGYLTINTDPDPYPNGLPLHGKDLR